MSMCFGLFNNSYFRYQSSTSVLIRSSSKYLSGDKLDSHSPIWKRYLIISSNDFDTK